MDDFIFMDDLGVNFNNNMKFHEIIYEIMLSARNGLELCLKKDFTKGG